MKTIKRSEVMAACNSTMCITFDVMNYFGDSSGKVPVYDGSDPMMKMLGYTDGPIMRGQVSFGGVMFEIVRVEGSSYAMLNALVPGARCSVNGNVIVPLEPEPCIVCNGVNEGNTCCPPERSESKTIPAPISSMTEIVTTDPDGVYAKANGKR